VSADILVFYAGQLLEEHSHQSYPHFRSTVSQEIYNGAFVCVTNRNQVKHFGPEPGWHRLDGTPYLTKYVPKELLMLKLLYT
jgi:hypothetical protein